MFGEHTIYNGRDPYLRRVYLTPQRKLFSKPWWPGVFFHHFYRSDGDRFPHNHPWKLAISFVLRGGYTEHRWSRVTKSWTVRKVKPFSLNIIRAEDFHRVELDDPIRGADTLFFAFRHKAKRTGEEWGFLDTDTNTFIGWRKYLGLEADGLAGD